jgi:hypothetical protein
MHIRFATAADEQELFTLGVRAYSESRYTRYPVSPEKFTKLFDLTQGSSMAFAFVAEERDEIVGFVIGMITEHYLFDAKYGTFLVLYTLPRHGRVAATLLQAYEEEAQRRGAVESITGNSSGIAPARVLRWFMQQGYEFVGGNGVKYFGDSNG